mmetsp:Transcript_101777/g.202095  ORF Transcript_101777/g.202095 Transcript_101777/m.202095 type:complete len:274 (+) Transcript_101777:574-1395(+)
MDNTLAPVFGLQVHPHLNRHTTQNAAIELCCCPLGITKMIKADLAHSLHHAGAFQGCRRSKPLASVPLSGKVCTLGAFVTEITPNIEGVVSETASTDILSCAFRAQCPGIDIGVSNNTYLAKVIFHLLPLDTWRNPIDDKLRSIFRSGIQLKAKLIAMKGTPMQLHHCHPRVSRAVITYFTHTTVNCCVSHVYWRRGWSNVCKSDWPSKREMVLQFLPVDIQRKTLYNKFCTIRAGIRFHRNCRFSDGTPMQVVNRPLSMLGVIIPNFPEHAR